MGACRESTSTNLDKGEVRRGGVRRGVAVRGGARRCVALHADISGSQVQWTRRIKESKAGGMDGSNINVKEVRDSRYLVKRVGSSDEDPDNRSLNGLSKRSSTRSSDTRKIGRAEGWAPIH